MDIKILGSGCTKCRRLEANTAEALAALHLVADIEKVTDPAAIASWGVMSTPALVVDDDVLVVGRVATADEIRRLLPTT